MKVPAPPVTTARRDLATAISPASPGRPGAGRTSLDRVTDPRGNLGTGRETALCQDVRDVALRGALRDHQAPGDVRVAQSTRDQPGDLALTRGQPGPAVRLLPGRGPPLPQRVRERLVVREASPATVGVLEGRLLE